MRRSLVGRVAAAVAAFGCLMCGVVPESGVLEGKGTPLGEGVSKNFEKSVAEGVTSGLPEVKGWLPGSEGQFNNWPNPGTWNQTALPKTAPAGSPRSCGPSGGVWGLQKVGCLQFSMAFVLVRSGARPVGFGPVDLMRESDKASSKVADASCLGYPGNLHTYAPDVLGPRVELKTKETTGKESYDLIEKYWKEGYYLILGVMGSGGSMDGHWIAVDDVGGGKVSVMDSGSECTDFMTCARYTGGRLRSLYGFKALKKKPTETPKLVGAAGSQPANTNTEGDSKISGRMTAQGYELNELELLGMPKLRNLREDDGILPEPISALDINQSAQVAEMKENIEANNHYSLLGILRTMVSFLGIVAMLWGIVMMLAWIFDRTNTLFNFNLLGLVTFGKLRAAIAGDGTEGKASQSVNGVWYLNLGGIVWRSLLVMLVGLLLLSGRVYEMVMVVYVFMRDMFNTYIIGG